MSVVRERNWGVAGMGGKLKVGCIARSGKVTAIFKRHLYDNQFTRYPNSKITSRSKSERTSNSNVNNPPVSHQNVG